MNSNLKFNKNYSLNYLKKIKLKNKNIVKEETLIEEKNIENIKVYIRCKPFIKENKKITNIIDINKNDLVIKNPSIYVTNKREIYFKFNKIYDEIKNDELFKNVLFRNIKYLINGFSYTIFCYGITGSGKTYTLFGKQNEFGLFQLSCMELIKIPDIKVTLNFLEIYNEKVYDLLSNTNKNLQLHENNKPNGLIEIQINKIDQIKKIIQTIENKRKKAETINNINSTRSHLVCYINIEKKNKSGKNFSSKLTIIDLAGSEKFLSIKEKDLRKKEGANINKSLLTLANCIQAIINKKPNSHIPYRDSKITRIMKETWTGNTKTIMICCIHKTSNYFENTLNTLNYANKAMECKKEITQVTNNNKQEDKKNILSVDEYIKEFSKTNLYQNKFRNKNMNFMNNNKFRFKINNSFSNLKKKKVNKDILNKNLKTKLINWEKYKNESKFQDHEIIEDNLVKANKIVNDFEKLVTNNFQLKNHLKILKNYLNNALKVTKNISNKSVSYENSIKTNNNILGLKNTKKFNKCSQEKTIKNYSKLRDNYKIFKNDLKYISKKKDNSKNFLKKVLKVVNLFSKNGYIINNDWGKILDNLNNLELKNNLNLKKLKKKK